MKERIVNALAVALAASSLLFLILPFQAYLPNADDFSYSSGMLAVESALYFLGAFAGLSAVLFLSSRLTGNLLHVALLSLCAAIVLETGPLSAGLPELNGEFEGYRVVSRMVWDAAILFLVVLLPVLFFRKLGGWLVWTALALVFYSSAMLLDVGKASVKEDGPVERPIAPLVPREKVVESAEFSPKENVIVMVLDATSGDVVSDIFDSPAMRSQFPGFVHYRNNVGMHWNTSVGVPGLMTGKYYENALELPRYGRSTFSRDSFVHEYLEADIPVYLNVGPGKVGITNRLKQSRTGREQQTRGCRSQPMYGQFALSLNQLMAFKILPYCLKERYLQGFIAQTRTRAKTTSGVDLRMDGVLWPLFMARGVAADVPRTLHVHHTESGHPPIVFDGDGRSISCENPTYSNYYGQCMYAFRNVGRLFDVWRTNGVYDASTIIMLGDHSASSTFWKPGVPLRGADPHSFPFLMVKPRGTRADFAISDIPTSHSKVAPLVRELRKKACSRAEIESILRQEERLVRLAANGKINDWWISPDRSVRKTVRDDAEPDEKDVRPLVCGRQYTFHISGGVYPDFIVRNGNRNVTSGLAVTRNAMSVRFRFPEKGRRYAVELTTYCRATRVPENHVSVSCGGQTQEKVARTKVFNTETFHLDGVVPDDKGFVTIECRADDLGYANFTLTGLRIDEQAAVPQAAAAGPSHGVLCLSFDDRRSIKSWVGAIPLFAKYGARCSFFVNGIPQGNDLEGCRLLHAAGHDVGLHTAHHIRIPEAIDTNGVDRLVQEELAPQIACFAQVGIRPTTLAYPYNFRTQKSDQVLLSHGIKRLRASVPDYSKQLKQGVGREKMRGGMVPASDFSDLKVVHAYPIPRQFSEIAPVLERAAAENMVVGLYSHAISTNRSNDVSCQMLEQILARARELGMTFRTLAD